MRKCGRGEERTVLICKNRGKMDTTRRGEITERNLKTKVVYRYVDTQRGISLKSREVYKTEHKEVHFPFNPRNGRQKYKTILTITYDGITSSLPSGFLKTATTGYGFTRELAPILYELQKEIPTIAHVVISTTESSKLINKKTIIFALPDLQKARSYLSVVQKRHKDELSLATNNILAELIPSKFKERKITHHPGELYEFIKQHSLRPSELSDDDLGAAASLLASLPSSHPFVLAQSALAMKASFDRALIEELIRKYNKLLALKRDTKGLENRWQEFFSRNLLYFNFGYVQKFEKELIVGDKTLNFPDFTMLNSLGYLDVFEIKTHLTQLLSFDNGRKNFFWTSESAKAISQVENYIDSLIKREDEVIKNIRDEYNIHSVDAVRPLAYIIASSRECIAGENTNTKYKGKLFKKLWNDFRRLNNSLHNVRFILYDELLETFESMLTRLGAEASK